MNINFQYHNVTASDQLEIYTSTKLDKLFKRYDFVVNADVYFGLQNSSEVDKGKICKVRLGTPGQTLFTEASNSNFEISVNEVTKELETQLKKSKGKFAKLN